MTTATTPERGQTWVHPGSGRRVKVERVGKRKITFVARRSAGSVCITYKTSLAHFLETYRLHEGRAR
jgi:hypothetical protein